MLGLGLGLGLGPTRLGLGLGLEPTGLGLGLGLGLETTGLGLGLGLGLSGLDYITAEKVILVSLRAGSQGNVFRRTQAYTASMSSTIRQLNKILTAYY